MVFFVCGKINKNCTKRWQVNVKEPIKFWTNNFPQTNASSYAQFRSDNIKVSFYKLYQLGLFCKIYYINMTKDMSRGGVKLHSIQKIFI